MLDIVLLAESGLAAVLAEILLLYLLRDQLLAGALDSLRLPEDVLLSHSTGGVSLAIASLDPLQSGDFTHKRLRGPEAAHPLDGLIHCETATPWGFWDW
jgi:hypothetical protein